MKRTLYILIATALIALCTGCASFKPDGDTLRGAASVGLTAASIAAPEYATALKAIGRVIAPQAATNPLDGYVYGITYRYRGQICESADITWEEHWTRLGSAGSALPPAGEQNGSPLESQAETELRAEIRAIVQAAGLGEDAQ